MSVQIDMGFLKQWLNKEQVETAAITPDPFQGLAATLGHEDVSSEVGTVLPPLWQWLYFLKPTHAKNTGHDGHAQKGGFMPPVPLPRRMWAGDQLNVHRLLEVGDVVTKISKISDITLKQGKQGPLIFVAQEIDFKVGGKLRLQEKQQTVYRTPADPSEIKNSVIASTSKQSAIEEYQPDWIKEVQPDPVLLFRYSALTLNSHRIHYDRNYAMEKEGYPGLVVHGPLVALMLCDFVKEILPRSEIKNFECRTLSPLFDIHGFSLMAKQIDNRIELRSINHEGTVSLSANAEIT